MRHRVLRACLRAYPRALRERDGAELLALAEELAADRGAVREALGLVRGGWVERRRRASRRRRALAASTASGVAVLAVLTWAAAAAADPGRVEEERFGCAGDCRSVERQVRHLVDDGWTCAERRETTSTTWRCTLD